MSLSIYFCVLLILRGDGTFVSDICIGRCPVIFEDTWVSYEATLNHEMVSVLICRIAYLILTTGVLASMHKILIFEVVLPVSLKVDDGRANEEEKDDDDDDEDDDDDDDVADDDEDDDSDCVTLPHGSSISL